MRDYADYFSERRASDKRGVSMKRNLDWWLDGITNNLAKLLFLILFAIIALVLKYFWLVGKSDAFFPVEHITLTGDVMITQPRDVSKLLPRKDSRSFFSLDLDAASQKLESLPWVESARIERVWPNKLIVSLVERKAAYRWGDSELIDSDGNRFANVDTELFAILPQIHGGDGSEKEVMKAYQFLIHNLGISAERLKIDKFIRNEFLSWELHLASGVVIIFGRNEFKTRAARFAEAFQEGKTPDMSKLIGLDFRYSTGFSAKWKPEFDPAKPKELNNNVATDI